MKIIDDLDLTPYNSYHVVSYCRRAFFPENEEDIRYIFQKFNTNDKIILGNGNNVILSKSYYDQDFIIFNGNFSKISILNDTAIHVEAGIDLLSLSEFALTHQLSGLEIFFDIPSSFGGAIVMNAGASGEDIHSLLQSARYYNPISDQFFEIFSDDISMGYRNSYFQQNPHLLITSGILNLKSDMSSIIQEKMLRIREQRWSKQPKDLPNAGSVFKRPDGYYVGAIMEDLKLKGFSVGGAKVSEKHGGFIVNFDNATGSDILAVIDHVQECVEAKYGFRLDVEQRII